MLRGKRLRMAAPSQTALAAGILGAAFLAGGVLGCVAAGWMDEPGARALGEYLTSYFGCVLEGMPLPGFWSVVWEQFRFPLAAFILGFTAIGVVGLPALFGVRGFLFSFSAACFYRLLGAQGVLCAFCLFGLPAALWAPALFVLGSQGMLGAYGMLRRGLGEGNWPLPYGPDYFVRCGLCAGAIALCVGLELFVVPELLPAAARAVLGT